MIYYVCKYTPVEIFSGFGEETAVLDHMAPDFHLADQTLHGNICGYGKALVETVLSGGIEELVLVNCCDVMRRVYDVLKAENHLKFLYLMDLPHSDGPCQIDRFAEELKKLIAAYERYSKKTFDVEAFKKSFRKNDTPDGPYIALLGARVGREIVDMVEDTSPLPVRNLTCVGNRDVETPCSTMEDYAAELLRQMPCRRMIDISGRRALYNDPNLKGILFHTVKFCDYYAAEFMDAQKWADVPMTKIETDFTLQSKGQLATRIEAFIESLGLGRKKKKAAPRKGEFFAGIDSGSTSTDAVIMDSSGKIVGSSIMATGGGARHSAEEALSEALKQAGLKRNQIVRIVPTGYGRANISADNNDVTEISCHAKGAHYIYPEARTVIDIGGQDSKVIRLNPDGSVAQFVMNDKCAAGTGRFLEMMARTLGMTLSEMSSLGLKWNEDIVISSMCTVFAESEVVSLVAQNKNVPDIIHGLNDSVAKKIKAMVGQSKGEAPYIITGGVAQNAGVVKAIEARLNAPLYVSDDAQICGAIGAALYAMGR